METKAIKEQSLFDLSLQVGGGVEAVFDLALSNGLSITGELEPGQVIIPAIAQDSRIVDYYRVKNIRPATFSGEEILTLSGVGYMAIEENNIVS